MYRIARNPYTHQLHILRDGTPLDGGYDTMDAAMAVVRKHIANETPTFPQGKRTKRESHENGYGVTRSKRKGLR